ncbi:Polysaccharide pyruvyl transferase [Microbulbifer thermotolerans]|uniref:polysaccharide pyruvyl transferase family protein n=1 Tax=Microbulbifer thermotolerans TaxID=252514 RepID=UPI0008E1C9E8|nr:polysaccharide pyruvyl transferase family protein [Microbulbifer thermotolerans]MCX2794490.1 polysaccharide pyruvyl transferase family protein [Microbulbifer thermotolerans]SFB89736.1 Polysaccharide pyruvyl transferase [Microbulbifer thermotolerans]
MKILFYPYHIGAGNSKNPLPIAAGCPQNPARNLRELKSELRTCTHNVGNIIHVEAPSRSLQYDKFNSCFTFFSELYEQYNGDIVAIAKEVSKKYDAVVISEANVIRFHGRNKVESEANTKRLSIIADILNELTVPFYVMGVGVQTKTPPILEDFDKNIVKFLKVCESKAALFAVRGRASRDWLRAAGINNVVVLGCPSMFVYPENILAIEAPKKKLSVDLSIVTAGYLRDLTFKYDRCRSQVILNLSKLGSVHYVFQDDIYQNDEIDDSLPIYNEASGAVNKEYVDRYLLSKGFCAPEFVSYRHFRNSNAWRQFLSSQDLYFGDRLHCGIASMQASVPSILIYDDLRVEEIVSLFSIPSISLGELKRDFNFDEIITEKLSRSSLEGFKENYVERYSYYVNSLRKVGLNIFKRI